ncbi:MAG: phytase [Bacteroidales bacterium]|nr:phytase [Bacteroidales bacterium]
MKYLANRIFLIAFFSAVVVSCNRSSEGARKAGEHIQNLVSATTETEPTPRGKNDDSADDPAIWVHPGNVMQSVVIGTDKKGGLATYNLSGELLNYYPDGKMNNCDLRYGFNLGGDTIDILAASNRTMHSLSIYKISEGGKLDSIQSRVIKSAMMDEVYGLCMYKSKKTGKFFVFMNSKAGEVEQWELFGADNKIDAKLVRSFLLGTQTEGMVADDEAGILYIGEEQAGIYKFDAEPEGTKQGRLVTLSTEENPNIRYDIEGLTIYPTDSVNGYLIASSQGNYSYAIFERQGDNRYIGSFRIADGNIDGVEETDGIDVCNAPVGSRYPKGIFVVQDGYNYEGDNLLSQNYKFISWEDIEKLFK